MSEIKVLLLSNNDNVKQLYEWLKERENVMLYHDRITLEVLEQFQPDIVISYNYRYIIKEDVISRMGDRIINLHTSFLPWNRGSSPNIWSFIDDTRKGVTIHRLEKGLDTGEIIVQKEIWFDENKETLFSSYERLNKEIVELLEDNWADIRSGNYTLTKQSGAGTYHTMADLESLLSGEKIDYKMTITEFKQFVAERRQK